MVQPNANLLVHQDEFILMQQVRADPNAAPTAMTAVGTKTMVDGFGQTITAPTGYSFLTPTSGDGRGETPYTIAAPVVTIDGSTYNQTILVSDRTFGPFEGHMTITGTGAATLSWCVNARYSGDSGTGTGYQSVEGYGVGSGGIGSATFLLYNPTRDGGTPSPFVSATPAAPPIVPSRDLRTHGGQPIYFSAGGAMSETCVAPIDFNNDVGESLIGLTSIKGETVARSSLGYGGRIYQRLKMGWGKTAVTRATTHRHDIWRYAPKRWSPSDVNGQALAVSFGTSLAGVAGYWNEATIYDLVDMSTFAVPGPLIAEVVGVDNHQSFSFSRRGLLSFDASGAVTGQVVRSPTASPYVAIVFRNSVTDIAYGFAVKMGDLSAADLAQDPFLFVRDVLPDLPDAINVRMAWNATTPAAPAPPEVPQWVAVSSDAIARRREPGWLGYAEYRSYGRTAHVLAALRDLYTSGDIDRRPENYVPGAVNRGTYWRNAPLNAERIKQRVKLLLERS